MLASQDEEDRSWLNPAKDTCRTSEVETRLSTGNARAATSLAEVVKALTDVKEKAKQAAKELPRTNNAQEGWHRRFASQVNCHHPSIWKIITNIADEEQHVQQRREQLVAGHAAPGRKKRYVDRDAKILRIVQSYDNREPLEFLRGIAHNLSFHVSE